MTSSVKKYSAKNCHGLKVNVGPVRRCATYLQQSQNTDTKAVAEREGLHPETVRSVYGQWAKRAEKKQQGVYVRYIEIDEISLRKGISNLH